MTDDKRTLTRRRVLGGMATIGVAGAVGAGTWAQMSDEERATVNAQAGSIDLKVDGEDAVYAIDFGDVLQNGDNPSTSVTLTNTGSLDGQSLCFSIENYSSSENNTPESETNTDESDGGELGDVSELTIELGGTTIASNPEGNGGIGCVSGPLPLGSGKDLTVTLNIPEENINEAMDDSLSFDLVMTLYDEPHSQSNGSGT